MTLEVLFARQAQREAFLLLMGCGVGLGVLAWISGVLGGLWRPLGALGDIGCAAGTTVAVLQVVLWTGAALRLYAVLGLLVGLLLYLTGLAPLLRCLKGRDKKMGVERAEGPSRG